MRILGVFFDHDMNEESSSYTKVSHGVPQGSILGLIHASLS